ncbi:MAG: DUF2330 domain-containing protein [Chitinophagaceae bacterium]|nr:DUF2330 domain-containing protein [Chitinophagaceae bacterium]
MKQFILVPILIFLLQLNANAFCGFYVAKADTKIYNNASQVILVRDGNKTIITMSNDFQGDVKDFAMVVPVPNVLKKSDIKVSNQLLFDKLDAYSAPRLVEYYDQNPCMQYHPAPVAKMSRMETLAESDSYKEKKDASNYGVQIKAKYTVGEYDILILGASESSGLKNWLIDHGYKIPAEAEEVLTPYILSKMNFFVAKVNLKNYAKNDFQQLSPLQIKINSPKFMLPIRLGMANSKGNQDLIIYSFSKNGKIECTNYRTVNMPTAIDMPVFIKDNFNKFYKDLFKKQWKRQNENVVFTEYAWDVSPRNFVKCDPCVSDPPDFNDIKDAGVNWWNDETEQVYPDRNGNIFFTRLHVRYNRKSFAQDLRFQETGNLSNWQARYVLHHTANGDLSCNEGQRYINTVVSRRETELANLEKYVGWNKSKYTNYVQEWRNKVSPYYQNENRKKGNLSEIFGKNWAAVFIFLIFQISIVFSILKFKK